MERMIWQRLVVGVGIVAGLSGAAPATGSGAAPLCKPVHAELVEDRFTVGCKPEHTFCFLGVVDGNHGLRGTTYFKGDGNEAAPASAPGWRSYSGLFEYTTDRGTIVARETGVVNTTRGNPESGAVTAYQKILETTGEFAGSTGYLFVNGFNIDNHIVTTLSGEICAPQD